MVDKRVSYVRHSFKNLTLKIILLKKWYKCEKNTGAITISIKSSIEASEKDSENLTSFKEEENRIIDNVIEKQNLNDKHPPSSDPLEQQNKLNNECDILISKVII